MVPLLVGAMLALPVAHASATSCTYDNANKKWVLTLDDSPGTYVIDFFSALQVDASLVPGCATNASIPADYVGIDILVSGTSTGQTVTITNVQRWAGNLTLHLGGGDQDVITLRGSTGNDTFVGLDSGEVDADTQVFLEGLAGDDAITGGTAPETISGGAGADRMAGGAGDGDILTYISASSPVTVTLNGKGSAGDASGDVSTGFEELQGSDLGDSLTGSSGDNLILGEDGDDVIAGGRGNDEVRGGEGLDRVGGGRGTDDVYGDAGADVLLYGGGIDTLNGGDGTDACQGWNTASGDPLTGSKRFADATYEDCESDTR